MNRRTPKVQEVQARRFEHRLMILDSLPILAAAPLGVWSVLWDILVLLAMALVLGTVAERLGQSVIVGYLRAALGVARRRST